MVSCKKTYQCAAERNISLLGFNCTTAKLETNFQPGWYHQIRVLCRNVNICPYDEKRLSSNQHVIISYPQKHLFPLQFTQINSPAWTQSLLFQIKWQIENLLGCGTLHILEIQYLLQTFPVLSTFFFPHLGKTLFMILDS